MEFGVGLGIITAGNSEFASTCAQEAERLGFAGLWEGDHVVGFEHYDSPYPYTPSEDFNVLGPGGRFGGIGTFEALAVAAASTSRIRLGTSVLLVPQRNPVYSAQSVTSLDHFSNGRFNFGVGVGWAKEEFEAVGADFAQRDKRCREHIEVMKKLWTDENPSFDGDLYQLPRCRQEPKPIQKPHPPIFFGGNGDHALRRVADLGTGWYGYHRTPEEAAETIGCLRELYRERGRDPKTLRVVMGQMEIGYGETIPPLTAVDRALIEAYEQAGVTHYNIDLFINRGETKATVEKLHDIAQRLM
jgi:probable F420-dependent oxidoreductase